MQQQVSAYEMVAVGAPLHVRRTPRPTLRADQVRVRVAGCGLCHTDLGFLDSGVPTRHALPIVLGHEVSGVVIEAGAEHRELLGKPVVVPAVLPCGQCEDCRSGHPMICRAQVMPGNDADGGFADELVVPGHGLCVVPGRVTDPDAPIGKRPGVTLRHLAVIADAVSTPYQAIARSGLVAGGLCIVVGLGGVGGYAVQIARARGATVVGIDPDHERRAQAEAHGAIRTFDGGLDPAELKRAVRAFTRETKQPASRWVVLECSGTAAGQRTAFELLVHGATLMVVGYATEPVTLQLSRLMAFDARAIGTWGCEPALYPEIVDLVLSGGIDVVDSTELRPLSAIEEAFADVRQHRAHRRIVLVPDGGES
jgi:6-hydroxycyclohex-1-ene-1-carbonyl-CoA dehydrogenase